MKVSERMRPVWEGDKMDRKHKTVACVHAGVFTGRSSSVCSKRASPLAVTCARWHHQALTSEGHLGRGTEDGRAHPVKTIGESSVANQFSLGTGSLPPSRAALP